MAGAPRARVQSQGGGGGRTGEQSQPHRDRRTTRGPRPRHRRARRRLGLRDRLGPRVGPPGALGRLGADRVRRPRRVVTHGPTTLIHLNLHSSTIRSLAEVTLALVLFADASRVNVRALRADAALPAAPARHRPALDHRGGGRPSPPLLFGGSGLWVAAAIGAIVAPTDAALGRLHHGGRPGPLGRPPAPQRRERSQRRHRHPVRQPLHGRGGQRPRRCTASSRRTAARRARRRGRPRHRRRASSVLSSWRLARRHGWSAPGFRPLAILALALFAYSTSVLAGTNGFIAAFVAGMAFGTVDHHNDEAVLRFTEEGGHPPLPPGLVHLRRRHARAGPGRTSAGATVVFALVGPHRPPDGARRPGARRQQGWTGPRWSSSAGSVPAAWPRSSSASSPSTPWRPPKSKVVLGVVTVTVALSVLLHGVSASPLAARYGAAASGYILRAPSTPRRRPSRRGRCGRSVPPSPGLGASPGDAGGQRQRPVSPAQDGSPVSRSRVLRKPGPAALPSPA